MLETNLLHGRADPESATDAKTILRLAAQTGIKVAIPEPCLVELREAMREKLRTARKGLVTALDDLKRLHVQVDLPSLDEERVLAEYDRRVEQFMTKYDIGRVPFPKEVPDVRTLFALAAKKEPPFDATGNSYRDAMIALSVQES